MYYPYFRGKQFELIAIRETAHVFAESGFVPIIEPVREQIRGLHKALSALCDVGAEAIVIINPQHGELAEDVTKIGELLEEEFEAHDNLMVGIRLHAELTSDAAIDLCAAAGERTIALIHAGFKDASAVVPRMTDFPNISTSVFLDDECGKLYQAKFQNHANLVLVQDGFERRPNRAHPEIEFFSDLHVTFSLGMEAPMTGIGDFLIVGDDYSESGGPAYTVAIHLTFIDPDQDEAMYIRHFLSDSRDTPKNPGGKFGEALGKLIRAVEAEDSKILETSAVREFRDLYDRQHYPGLGSVKKLSMIHHIETLADFFAKRGD